MTVMTPTVTVMTVMTAGNDSSDNNNSSSSSKLRWEGVHNRTNDQPADFLFLIGFIVDGVVSGVVAVAVVDVVGGNND